MIWAKVAPKEKPKPDRLIYLAALSILEDPERYGPLMVRCAQSEKDRYEKKESQS